MLFCILWRCEIGEQGSSSKMLLMATWSKKILVLGWAPPDKDVVEHVDVDGDLVQEDLSTWMGTTWMVHLHITIRVAHSVAPPLPVHIHLLSSSNIQVWMVCCWCRPPRIFGETWRRWRISCSEICLQVRWADRRQRNAIFVCKRLSLCRWNKF